MLFRDTRCCDASGPLSINCEMHEIPDFDLKMHIEVNKRSNCSSWKSRIVTSAANAAFARPPTHRVRSERMVSSRKIQNRPFRGPVNVRDLHAKTAASPGIGRPVPVSDRGDRQLSAETSTP